MIKKENKQKKVQHQNDKPCSCLCHTHVSFQCYCACRYQKGDSGHQPFLIRTCIVASGVPVGFFGYAWGWHKGEVLFWKLGLMTHAHYCLTVALACYFCWVTLWDGLTHYVLKLKSSSFADKGKLLQKQGVTPQELDHYCDTRRYIRFASFSMAALVFGLFCSSSFSSALIAFCVAYIFSSLLGILLVRRVSSSKPPQGIRLDNQYYRPTPPLTGHNYILWSQGKLPYWW